MVVYRFLFVKRYFEPNFGKMSSMKKPLVSVIVPAYNEENSIKKCLTSIFSQDFPIDNYEVIVVNNNSTDKTAEIIKKYFPKVKLISEKKQGVVFARIKGVESAKGKIITFTDADSIAQKYWLKNIVMAFKDPKVTAVGAIAKLGPETPLSKFAEPIINKLNLAFKIMSGFDLSFRKEAYNKVGGFSPKVNLAEDFYLSIKIKKTGKVVILKKNAILSSSRRYTQKEFFPYAAKYLLNVTSITFFDKSLFFNFKPIRNTDKKPSLKDYLSSQI